MALDLPTRLKNQATIELARRRFWHFCEWASPEVYQPDRKYLIKLCDDLEDFVLRSDKKIMVVNLPPRHGKSYTASNLVKWLFGSNHNLKIMTGSYNETLSTRFAKSVRDNIAMEKTSDKKLVYKDIFPRTSVMSGDASASSWRLTGSDEVNYLATSPRGSSTGFGANVLVVDDIIKNHLEAYSETILDGHWDWFNNTMLSRLQGQDWKILLIMTRWATNDLAGRVMKTFPNELVHLSFPAVISAKKRKMLCSGILSYDDFIIKTKSMNEDIVEANYNQKPINVKGQMYPNLMTYKELPKNDGPMYNFTDTADTGNDFLCSINYFMSGGDVYITDMVYTDESMETTEPLVADLLSYGGVSDCKVESNSGGRGFMRNVERLCRVKGNHRTLFTAIPHTTNKEARILTSSAWVNQHVMLPLNWNIKFNLFHREVTAYQKKGKNKHDDGVDVLASIYEHATNFMTATVTSKSKMGFSRHSQTTRGLFESGL